MEEKKVKVNIDETNYIINPTIAIERVMYELGVTNEEKLKELLKHYPNPTNNKSTMTMQDIVKAMKLNEEVCKSSMPQDEVTILKRQLKHCKSYVERQNIERRINELHRKERNEIHLKQYGTAKISKFNIN